MQDIGVKKQEKNPILKFAISRLIMQNLNNERYKMIANNLSLQKMRKTYLIHKIMRDMTTFEFAFFAKICFLDVLQMWVAYMSIEDIFLCFKKK